jgi:hypothetical protein
MVTFIKILSHRRKFSNSDSVKQKSILNIIRKTALEALVKLFSNNLNSLFQPKQPTIVITRFTTVYKENCELFKEKKTVKEKSVTEDQTKEHGTEIMEATPSTSIRRLSIIMQIKK